MANKFMFFFVLIMGFAQAGIIAQDQKKDVIHQSLYWLRYSNSINFNDVWRLNIEIENRRYFRHNRQHQWVLPRMFLHRKMKDGWSMGVGVNYFLQSLPHDGESKIEITVPELRLSQELNYRQNIGQVSLGHRYIVEERFVHKAEMYELTKGYNFNLRIRYMLQLSIPIIKKETLEGTLSFKTFDEIMINVGQQIVRNTFDQNRFGIGVNYGISEHVALQLDAINWFQQRPTGDSFFNRNILRFTIHHTITRKD